MSQSSTAARAAISAYNESIAWDFNFVLLGLLCFCALATLPRVIARLSSDHAWAQGWILRFTPPSRSRNTLDRQPSARRNDQWQSTLANIQAYDEKNAFAFNAASYTSAARTHAEVRNVPLHCPSWSTALHPLSSRIPFVSKSILGYPSPRAFLLFIYAVLFTILLLVNSNPVSNRNRAGWIGISQYPVAVLLSSKNSVVGTLVGKGYERLNFVHRWVGKLIFIAALFHVVAYLVQWTKQDSLQTSMTRQTAVAGITALGGLTLLSLGAIPAIRRSYYTLFGYCHWIGFLVTMIATCFHTPVAIPFALSAIGLLALDYVLRLIQSHYTTATLHYIPEMDTTRVSIPSLRNGWRAGQHVRLCVPSAGMGSAMLESHPFTISSCSDEGEEGLVLYVKVAGDWTKKLAELARGTNSTGSGLLTKGDEAGYGSGRNINVIVQGPYGGPGNAILSSYSGTMLVCGGSGITFGLSALNEIMRDVFDRSSNVRLIDFVWVVQDPTSIVPVLPAFEKLLEQASVISSVSLKINIHYTRATASSPFRSSQSLPEGLSIEAGRPDIKDALYALIGCASTLKTQTRESKVHGVLLGVCGPQSMVQTVRCIESGVGGQVRKAVGGLELMEGAFMF